MKHSVRKRFLAVLSAALMAVAVVALAACGDKNGGGTSGEVSDSVWQDRLTVSVDACKSCTVTMRMEPKYGKDEIEEYGEYDRDEEIYYIDFENEIMHTIHEDEEYDDSEQVFKKDKREEYYFKYKDGYYRWEKSNSDQANVYKGTKAAFIDQSETPANAASQFSVYAQMKSAFRYNEETQSYDLAQYGTMKISLQFPNDGGVRMIFDATSTTQEVISLTGVDKTTVTVPDNVKADIDAYIAEQAAKAA